MLIFLFGERQSQPVRENNSQMKRVIIQTISVYTMIAIKPRRARITKVFYPLLRITTKGGAANQLLRLG